MKKNESKKKDAFSSTVWNDFKKGGFKQPLSQDFRDLYDFYIDNEARKKYAKMNIIKRRILVGIQIFKNMILKLTPARRLLLFIALIVLSWGGSVQTDSPDVNIQIPGIGLSLILVVLMLELKDKLLAKDELETGRQIQMALMPEESPDIPGWDVFLYTQSANEVGGDLVDYQKLSDVCCGFALGDVAGKGLGAALVMAKLQASIRALAPLNKGVGWLGEQMNAIFVRDCLPGRFASLVYFELSVETGKINFFNAGHLPPVIKRGNHVQMLDKGTVALGLMKDAIFKPSTFQLEEDEFFIVFSDGVTEAQDKSLAFFGEERLIEMIKQSKSRSSVDIAQEILSEVSEFEGDMRSNDDLSLIVLRRKTSR